MLHIFLIFKFIVYSPKVLTVHVQARWFVIVTGRLRETWSSHESRIPSSVSFVTTEILTCDLATHPCHTHQKPSSLPPIPDTLTHLCSPHTHIYLPLPPTLTSASPTECPHPCHSHQNGLTPAIHTFVLVSFKINSDREQGVLRVELHKKLPLLEYYGFEVSGESNFFFFSVM